MILFGAGANGKSMLKKIQDKFADVSFLFCDNDMKKQNTIYEGVKIVGFEEMLELYLSTQIEKIILTVQNEQEILCQCVSMGIDINDLYYWDEKYEILKHIQEKYVSNHYSQDGEEIFLRTSLFCQKDNGVYIDIGANHPLRFSNTHWAYLRGWRGINIEPDIINYELLRNIRKEDININCGISDEETQLEYYMFKENALNTFCISEITNKDAVIEVRKVPVRRLDSILEEYGVWKVDYVDIDVEGMELKVLNSIDWDRVEISCILVEQKGMSLYDVLESEVCKLLESKGYYPVNKYNRTVIYVFRDKK